MKTRALRDYIEPLLTSDLTQLQTIRIGTKALAYWPQRFVTDDDAGDLLRLFEQIIRSGRHVAIMAHYSHPRELATPVAQRAVSRLRAAGCEIRMQAPIIRHVNDSPQAWASLWRHGVKLGMIPYYLFISRDTGPKNYFERAAGRVVCHLPQSLQPGFGAGADGARAGHVGHARQGADQRRDPGWRPARIRAELPPGARSGLGQAALFRALRPGGDVAVRP